MSKADDLAFVATTFNVKAAVPVAVLAFHSLLGVKGVAVKPNNRIALPDYRNPRLIKVQ